MSRLRTATLSVSCLLFSALSFLQAQDVVMDMDKAAKSAQETIRDLREKQASRQVTREGLKSAWEKENQIAASPMRFRAVSAGEQIFCSDSEGNIGMNRPLSIDLSRTSGGSCMDLHGFNFVGQKIKGGAEDKDYFMLSDSDLRNVRMYGISLENAALARIDLRSSAKFPAPPIYRTVLRGAHLKNVYIFGPSDFSRIDAYGIIMENVDMMETDLIDADFSHSRLAVVDFGDGDASRMDLSGAILMEVDLSGLKNGDRIIFDDTFYDNRTKLPDHLTPEQRAGLKSLNEGI